jgi:RNA polymerase-binding transcription factor DksA
VSDADRLRDERARVVATIEALTVEFDGIVAAADLSATDDEHDPEGSTIAFERQRVAAMLRDARDKLCALDEALASVAAGEYGICASCGGPIGDERLAALPATRTCIACAGGGTSRSAASREGFANTQVRRVDTAVGSNDGGVRPGRGKRG